MTTSTLEKDVASTISVNWDKFDSSEIDLIRKAINDGNAEYLASIVMEVTPEKASEIEKIQKQLRPQNFAFTSRVQKEFEVWLATHQNELTPAIEQEWQAKIDAERAEFLKMQAGGIEGATMKALDGTQTSQVTASNNLKDLKGLSDKSIKKLNDANVFTVEDFRKLGHDKRKEIIGPIVAFTFKNLN